MLSTEQSLCTQRTNYEDSPNQIFKIKGSILIGKKIKFNTWNKLTCFSQNENKSNFGQEHLRGPEAPWPS